LAPLIEDSVVGLRRGYTTTVDGVVSNEQKLSKDAEEED
jgi:hypothetical protein